MKFKQQRLALPIGVVLAELAALGLCCRDSRPLSGSGDKWYQISPPLIPNPFGAYISSTLTVAFALCDWEQIEKQQNQEETRYKM